MGLRDPNAPQPARVTQRDDPPAEDRHGVNAAFAAILASLLVLGGLTWSREGLEVLFQGEFWFVPRDFTAARRVTAASEPSTYYLQLAWRLFGGGSALVLGSMALWTLCFGPQEKRELVIRKLATYRTMVLVLAAAVFVGLVVLPLLR